ncbi:DUF6082 family protein [Streptomyces massasporeus]
MDWALLGEISQTYAAVSVPLTAVALLGAIASLGHQARQAHISHLESSRSTQQALLLRAFEDPALLVCWGPHPYPITRERWRQFSYVNMIVGFWHSEYKLGRSDDTVLTLAKRLFRGDVGYEYWLAWGPAWEKTTNEGGRKSRRFYRVMEAAFAAAEAEGPPLPSAEFFTPDPARTDPRL